MVVTDHRVIRELIRVIRLITVIRFILVTDHKVIRDFKKAVIRIPLRYF